MAEDLESGIYRGEWWRSGTQEMPQWITWGSEKQNYGQEPSISGDSTMFTASSASPPLMDFGLPTHQLLQKRERNMLEDKAPTFRPTIRQDETATQHDNSLSSSNLGSNTTRRFPVIPPFFPAATSDDEACLSWSTVPSSLKPSYPNQYRPSNQSFFFHNSPSSNTSPESSGDRCSSGSLFSQNLSGKSILTKDLPHVGPMDPLAGAAVQQQCVVTVDSSSEMKKTSIGSATKRPRLDTPPFTTFKVRKEKLGDRVTALQQLVSPFGKTDTASVLFEAIEYIKFLHEQVTVLSNPYMKLSLENSDTGEENALRSRGLCLVPVSTTMNVAKENTADFWAPTFGGSYR